jgi:hypothetical protein
MSHISTFVSRRFEELHALLNARGYLLDFSGREHPRWEDDPPLGLIHMRAVLLPNADQDEDAEPDERITFTLLERWSEHPLPDAQQREGLYLHGYSYHGQAGDAVFATSSTPTGTPSPPTTCTHRAHPTTSANQPKQPHPRQRSATSPC